MSYPNDCADARIGEFKHITCQRRPTMSAVCEFPRAGGDPYHPIPRPGNAALYKLYDAETKAMTNVTFVGRLATCRYCNTDQVVGQALAVFERLQKAHQRASKPVLVAARAGAGFAAAG